MIRCKPLLGTYVEITVDEDHHINCGDAVNYAFAEIEKVQNLMGFHNPNSELSTINAYAHLEEIEIHDWTYQVLSIAKDVYFASKGLFDCGIGSKLVASGLLPLHPITNSLKYGGLADLNLEKPNKVKSNKALRLDLGGIAKGFAVDKAVEALKAKGIKSGSVNAGGDLRVFGSISKEIQVRSPLNPKQLRSIGSLSDGSIASTSLYYSKSNMNLSPIINPTNMNHIQFTESYSVLAPECIYADALTKVFAISQDQDHPCFQYFSAKALRIAS